MANKSCKVLFDYRSQNPESELSINTDEILTVLTDDGDWWLCRNNNNQEGYVPMNYVEIIKGQTPSINSINNVDPYAKAIIPATMSRMVRAQHLYVANREDELGLEPDQIIEVIEESSDGWSKGRYNGKEGWFPANFVVEDASLSMGAGDNSAAKDGNNNNNSSQNILFKVKSNFKFNSANNEELAMEVDQILDIIDKGDDTSGWWRARNPQTGEVGLIPSNYVEAIEDRTAQNFGSTNNSQPEDQMVRTQPYYHDLGRKRAEESLQSKGTGIWLLRPSESNPSSSQFTITVRGQSKMRHFQVKYINEKWHIGNKQFDQMSMLINHYSRFPIFVQNSENLVLIKHM